MTETLSTFKKEEIPKHRNALQQKYREEDSHVKRLDPDNIKEVADQLPEPSGYRILLLPFTPSFQRFGQFLLSSFSIWTHEEYSTRRS